jgi:hypothetical protein
MLVKIINTIESVFLLNHVFGKLRQYLADLLQPRSLVFMCFIDRIQGLEIVLFYEEKVMLLLKSQVSRFSCAHSITFEVVFKYQS